MSKAKVNKLLKEEFGLANAKMQKDYSGFSTITIKEYGSMIKGVELASHSPMDCTSQASNKINATMQDIEHALCFGPLALKKDGRDIIVSENSKSITYVSLEVRRLPTYARSMNLDSGYQTSYMVPNFYKIEK